MEIVMFVDIKLQLEKNMLFTPLLLCSVQCNNTKRDTIDRFKLRQRGAAGISTWMKFGYNRLGDDRRRHRQQARTD